MSTQSALPTASDQSTYVPVETKIINVIRACGATRLEARYRRSPGHRAFLDINGLSFFKDNEPIAADLSKDTYDMIDLNISLHVDNQHISGTYHININGDRRDEPSSTVKEGLLADLKAWSITLVNVEYDGAGDDGCIGSIEAFCVDEPVKLTTEQSNAIEDAAWAFITSRFAGFENNEGGSGNVIIDVGKGSVTIEHNYNVLDTIYEEAVF